MPEAAASLSRIWALCLRHIYLHRRSMVRMFDIVFWPVMDLLVWGFVMLYIQHDAQGRLAGFIIFLIGALIGWDIHYRGQLAVSIAIMEEIWTRNIVNIFIAPVRLWEWIASSFLYGTIKISLVTLILVVIAQILYAFDLAAIGWAFFPLAAHLLFFGWTIGLFTSGLLLRFGYAAEALIWGIPFLLQPFSCVFYPLRVLPPWAGVIAQALPSTHIFEALRGVLNGVPIAWSTWVVISALNLVYFGAGLAAFAWMFRIARARGTLGRLGQE